MIIGRKEVPTFAHSFGDWNTSSCTVGVYRATLAKARMPCQHGSLILDPGSHYGCKYPTLGPSKPFLSAVEGGMGAKNHHDMLSIEFCRLQQFAPLVHPAWTTLKTRQAASPFSGPAGADLALST